MWSAFCASINADPYLSKVANPIQLLQAFGLHWRDGQITNHTNRACSVEDAIWLVCQKFLSLGAVDPRLNSAGKQDFCLTRMYAVWKKEDSLPA